ncbi:MAG: lantibiotic dehydratase C-terminal domain-containing protein [Lachnospiraceae bacterium]
MSMGGYYSKKEKYYGIMYLILLPSLLHMHFNRIFGVNREKEKEGLALTRHTIYALSQYEKNVKK